MATLTTRELHTYLRLPEVDRSELGRQVAEFVRDEFGMNTPETRASSTLLGASFSFRIDESGKNVEGKPFADGMRQWSWEFAVSCRAPLITCRTFTVGPVPDRAERPGGTYYQRDEPPRAEAVEWTQRVARQFGLTYVEARPLMERVVTDEELPPDLEDSLNYVPDFPSALLVLFLLY